MFHVPLEMEMLVEQRISARAPRGMHRTPLGGPTISPLARLRNTVARALIRLGERIGDREIGAPAPLALHPAGGRVR